MSGMRFFRIFEYVILFICLAFLMLPLLLVVSSAFSESNIVVFPPKGFTLDWFKQAFEKTEFLKSLWVTMKLCFVSVIPSTVLGVMLSLYFWKGPKKGRVFFETIFTAPIIVPTVISAVAFLIYFASFPLDTFWKLALGYIIIELPYVVRTVTASLSTFDASFEEAALVLGCKPLPTLLKVTLPCIKNGIFIGAVFAFIVAFDESVIIMFIRSARTISYPLRLYSYIHQSFTPLVSAFATIFIVLAFITIYILDKKIGIGKMYG